jgi:hypothetical protein
MKTTGRTWRTRGAPTLCTLLAVAGTVDGAAVDAACDGAAAVTHPEPGGVERPAWAAPGVPEAVWLLVDAASVERGGDRRKCLLGLAEAEARRAVEEAPDDVGRRFAVAVVLGLRADREGGRTKVRAASGLHDELRRILELDPEHAPARHLLGRLHAGVMRMDRVTRWIATHLLGGAALAEASWEGAEQNLAFAEERAPDVLDHHYELARLYRDTHRVDLAVEELLHVLERPAHSAMEGAVVAKAERLLQELTQR